MDAAISKTAQGLIPFHGCAINQGDEADGACLTFQLRSRKQVAELEAGENAGLLQASPRATLVELGSCMVDRDDSWAPDYDFIADFAQESGPLFGDEGDLNRVNESLSDWAYASYSAMLASRIQECVNGRRPVRSLAVLEQPRAMRVRNVSQGTSFTIYDAQTGASGAYAERFKDISLIVRLSTQGDRFFYSFIINQAKRAEDRCIIEYAVVALDKEMTSVELGYLCDHLQLSQEYGERAHSQLDSLGALDEGALGAYEEEDFEISTDGKLEQEDAEPLGVLVQAMVLAHTNRVRIDVFQGDLRTGYLTFSSLLDWMWYDFSTTLSTVSIGYCNHCGRPFSLVGHRGMERLYCSRKCKTEARNAKTRDDRERCRSLFAEGKSVEEIASEVYAGTQADKARVRKDLSKWVWLKRELEKSIESYGIEKSPLLLRCWKERLRVDQMLTVKRRAELTSRRR